MCVPAVMPEPVDALILIDDPDDERLSDYRHLNDPSTRQRLERDRGMLVVEGRVAVERLLHSGYRVRSLLVDDHQATNAAHLVDLAQALGVPVYVGRRTVVAATVGFALHRGVVAVAERPPLSDADAVMADASHAPSLGGGPPVVGVLEGLNDHENIGAMFRNAAAFGVAGMLLDPTCADPLYRRSVRVSAGHVLHVPFARLPDWPGGLEQVRANGFLVAALAPHASSVGTSGTDRGSPLIALGRLPSLVAAHPGGVAVVAGAEGPGLSDGALALADVVVSIPMAAGVDSLNVSTAAAIAFHILWDCARASSKLRPPGQE